MTNDQRNLLETQIERYAVYRTMSASASSHDNRRRYQALADATWQNIQHMLHHLQGVRLGQRDVQQAFQQ